MERFKSEGYGRHGFDEGSAAREHMGPGWRVEGPSSHGPCGSLLPFSMRFAVGMAFSTLNYLLFLCNFLVTIFSVNVVTSYHIVTIYPHMEYTNRNLSSPVSNFSSSTVNAEHE